MSSSQKTTHKEPAQCCGMALEPSGGGAKGDYIYAWGGVRYVVVYQFGDCPKLTTQTLAPNAG